MAISLETRCRRCGRSWVPLRADIIAGEWRICVRCRDPDARKPPTGGITRNPKCKPVQRRTAAQETPS